MIDRLRKIINDKGISQKELGISIGVSESQMSKAFKNKRKFSPEEIANISKYINISSDYILGIIDEPISSADCVRALNILKDENKKNQPDKLTDKIDDQKAKDIVKEIVRILFDE